MCEEKINTYAQTKRFGARTLARWLGCTPKEREALLLLAESLHLGENQFRDVFDQAQEIAARQQCSIGDVLEAPSVHEVLARGLGRNEAVRALKQSLRRLRFPQLAMIEERLAVTARALRLPTGVDVRFPENLEGEEISVHVKAKSAAQLRERVRKLEASMECPEVDEIFRLLEGDW